MGEDGHEYGPVSANQIRVWIAEQRLEKKSPVKANETNEWEFLGSLPEFAREFQSSSNMQKERQKLPSVAWVMMIFLIVIIIAVSLKKFIKP